MRRSDATPSRLDFDLGQSIRTGRLHVSDATRSAIADLTARVERQERDIAELRARQDRPRGRFDLIHASRRHRRRALAMGLTAALIAAPMLVYAATFTDVPATSPYYNDVTALSNAGVTTGCGGGNYCPKDFVTREQMAAFMNRLGALQAGKTPVVNATKLDGIDSTGFLRSGAIVVHQLGPWEPWLGSPGDMVVSRFFAETVVASATSSDSGGVVMALNLPASVAGKTFGFKSAEVCFSAVSVPAALSAAYVSESWDDGQVTDLVADETERDLGSAGCFTLTKATPVASTGATALRLHFFWNAAGQIFKVRSATITWTPVP
jgi:hypothetical protein